MSQGNELYAFIVKLWEANAAITIVRSYCGWIMPPLLNSIMLDEILIPTSSNLSLNFYNYDRRLNANSEQDVR